MPMGAKEKPNLREKTVTERSPFKFESPLADSTCSGSVVVTMRLTGWGPGRAPRIQAFHHFSDQRTCFCAARGRQVDNGLEKLLKNKELPELKESNTWSIEDVSCPGETYIIYPTELMASSDKEGLAIPKSATNNLIGKALWCQLILSRVRQGLLLISLTQFSNSSAPHPVCKADLSPPNRHAATKQLDRTKLFLLHGPSDKLLQQKQESWLRKVQGHLILKLRHNLIESIGACFVAFNLSIFLDAFGAAAIKISGWATPSGGVEKPPRNTRIDNQMDLWFI